MIDDWGKNTKLKAPNIVRVPFYESGSENSILIKSIEQIGTNNSYTTQNIFEQYIVKKNSFWFDDKDWFKCVLILELPTKNSLEFLQTYNHESKENDTEYLQTLIEERKEEFKNLEKGDPFNQNYMIE